MDERNTFLSYQFKGYSVDERSSFLSCNFKGYIVGERGFLSYQFKDTAWTNVIVFCPTSSRDTMYEYVEHVI